MTALGDLVALARQAWREDAACAGAFTRGDELVDPDPAEVGRLIRDYCHRCPVVGRCREQGDALAPFKKYGAIYGARYYAPGEPVEGWEVAS